MTAPFKGLSDRFQQTFKQIYNEFSLKGDPTNPSKDEPFLEFKPNDPQALETENDTRLIHPGSTVRETERLAKFLVSPRGTTFLVNQALLQTGNTFSETRIWDPASVGSGIIGDQDTLHLERSFGDAKNTSLVFGNLSDGTDQSPGSSGLGSAGRLQVSTKQLAISNLSGKTGATNLFNLIPSNLLSTAVSAISSVLDDGIVGVDDRPEIDFNGQFFSVSVWQGFKAGVAGGNPITQAISSISKGNIQGAINAISNGIADITRGIQSPTQFLSSVSPIVPISDTVRGDPNNTSVNGYRYFVLDGNDPSAVDRYLSNTVNFNSIGTGIAGQSSDSPIANMGMFNVMPEKLPTTSVQPVRIAGSANATAANNIINNITKLNSQIIAQQASAISKASNNTTILGSTVASAIPSLTNVVIPPSPSDGSSENPAFDKMTWPDLSLQSRYAAIASSIADATSAGSTFSSAKTDWQQTYISLESSDLRTYGPGRNVLGFQGGLKPGDDNTVRPTRYFSDPMNSLSPILTNAGTSNVVGDANMKTIRDTTGNLIDFVFYDYVNRKILPFRAFLTDIAENVSPAYTETQYIGRIERNIIYTGVIRELSFAFRIQAFNPTEMSNIWTKINYLTGMTFPSQYSSGFMVPPFTKLTIGNVWVDQPGYIKSLSYKIDDDGWEIDETFQAPMGITVNVDFSIIEKTQMQTNSQFYPFAGGSVPSNTLTPAPTIQSSQLSLPATLPGASVTDAPIPFSPTPLSSLIP